MNDKTNLTVKEKEIMTMTKENEALKTKLKQIQNNTDSQKAM